MMKQQVFYRCPHCGNIVGMIVDSGVVPFCCGEQMERMVPGATDGALEKHVPVIHIENGLVTVNVGEIDHPMLETHFIQWIYLQTTFGGHRRILHPGEKPTACFRLCDSEEVIGAYAYCNLHGLWHADC